MTPEEVLSVLESNADIDDDGSVTVRLRLPHLDAIRNMVATHGDLLAACKMAQEALELLANYESAMADAGRGLYDGSYVTQHAPVALRAAIAKATGKETPCQ